MTRIRYCVILFDNKCFKYCLNFMFKGSNSREVEQSPLHNSYQLFGLLMFEMSKQLADFFL